MEASHMLGTSMTGQRLRKSVSKPHPDKQDFHGNQQRNMYCCEQCFHLGPPQGS
jgi:hypothetical protein